MLHASGWTFSERQRTESRLLASNIHLHVSADDGNPACEGEIGRRLALREIALQRSRNKSIVALNLEDTGSCGLKVFPESKQVAKGFVRGRVKQLVNLCRKAWPPNTILLVT